jgi:hypothetical protein
MMSFSYRIGVQRRAIMRNAHSKVARPAIQHSMSPIIREGIYPRAENLSSFAGVIDMAKQKHVARQPKTPMSGIDEPHQCRQRGGRGEQADAANQDKRECGSGATVESLRDNTQHADRPATAQRLRKLIFVL